MPILSRKKRHSGSGGHSFFSSSHVNISEPTHLVKISGMANYDESNLSPRSPQVRESNGQEIGNEPLFDPHQVHKDVRDKTAHVREPASFTQDAPASNTSMKEALGSHPPQPTFDEDEAAPPPPDFTRRGIHIPTRTSSSPAVKKQFLRSLSGQHQQQQQQQQPRPPTMPGASDSGSHRAHSTTMSDTDSIRSYETNPSSTTSSALPPLQHNQASENVGRMSPLLEDDPKSFDLVAAPTVESTPSYSLEAQSELLFSRAHLQAIFDDPPSLHRFTAFLSAARPRSVPVLIYYLDALKAVRAVHYANAIAEALDPIDGLDFTGTPARPTVNAVLEDKARQAFDVLVRDDLPAYIAHVFIQVVSVSVQKRVTGNLPPMLREASEGLAEVFCLTDPSRPDNPIIFASEEFHRTTQYGVTYAIGRNCRFLQGPKTNRNSVSRLARAVAENKEINEVFLNYRRDGSPFMNLLMCAPLLDSRGTTRYHIGAQIDVSGLVKDSTGLDALQQLTSIRDAVHPTNPTHSNSSSSDNEEEEEEEEEGRTVAELRIAPPKDEFHALSEMFNTVELETVRRFGGSMHRRYVDDGVEEGVVRGRAGGKGGRREHRPRVLIGDQEDDDEEDDEEDDGEFGVRGEGRGERLGVVGGGVMGHGGGGGAVGGGGGGGGADPRANGKLAGVYKNYLILRPYPSLRILFVSPSLRVPGILQSRFIDRIGGSHRVRDSLLEALADGSRGVTAKVRWLSSAAASLDVERPEEGRPRWIHCTPLLGASGAVGVWMVVLVDDDKGAVAPTRRFRPAPPVPSAVRREKPGYREKDKEKSRSSSTRPTTAIPIESANANADFDVNVPRARSRNGGYRQPSSRQPSVDRAGPGGSGGASGVGLRGDVRMLHAHQQQQQPPQRSYSPALAKRKNGSAEPSINSFAL